MIKICPCCKERFFTGGQGFDERKILSAATDKNGQSRALSDDLYFGTISPFDLPHLTGK